MRKVSSGVFVCWGFYLFVQYFDDILFFISLVKWFFVNKVKQTVFQLLNIYIVGCHVTIRLAYDRIMWLLQCTGHSFWVDGNLISLFKLFVDLLVPLRINLSRRVGWVQLTVLWLYRTMTWIFFVIYRGPFVSNGLR